MKLITLALLALTVAGIPSDAHAYIDPGTGSMILQAVLGGVAGGILVIRLYWRKVRDLIVGRKALPAADTNAAPQAQSSDAPVQQ